ncbi:MAG: hypothetical protein CO029_01770 [Candidatus Magasanikbacteria bacterium CG_4_9_14_0_2_um_filter_41_10]|uniref:Fibronectin type-III domain-containing protein n=1 Tax=Candidatus Magasanikbacteria bacterium CG_4_10_14_0_2_um_filter_41_31 TaxID=1974639 RepID=A0A2M7V4T9_9BACT|nr:MAG: hypothetical protein AUJ37_04330 [Candidatus Magasanikbacteria bacterium CG1_02_41_34]PIZ93594.1 MAG: hypothetical protein COX83_01480 [Candidatus Magasanikbacteria bacterium CG_4_10_14_0_2_um_filter_41_31]PJC53632.1 MAG: hypothetical protein CO029_01770 [Candidatus Magasanikbacteria bacterium CG_4_9_14_0_2_um_filter_41_10]
MHTIFSFFKKQEERFWMTGAIFGIAMLAVLLPQLYDAHFDVVEAGDGSQGTPWTVCASGCDFTTLTSAFASSSVLTGNFITVNATYASSTETFPLNFGGKGITVDCALSGATIGTDSGGQVDILMASSSVLQQCNLSNTRLYLSDVSTATISGNIFATSTTGTIFFASSAIGNNITNNTGINNIIVGSGQQNLTITSNTIQTYHPVTNTSTVYTANTENFTFTSNTVRSYDSSVNNLISIRTATTTLISGNIFEYVTPPAVMSPNGAVYLEDTVSSTISYNYILLEQTDGVANQSNDGIYVYATTPDHPTDVVITHNTIWMYDYSYAVHVSDMSGASGPGGYFTLSANHNIFYNASSTRNGVGMYFHKYSATSTYSITNDYNGYYNFNENLSGSYLIYDTLPSLGSHSLTTNPYFKRDDVDTTNETQLAPFSFYLDANSTEDIGAYSATRGSSFTVDDTCTVDYSTCHATSSTAIVDNAVDGDIWTVATGAYSEIRLTSSTRLTGSITIDGAGATSIITPSTPGSALQFTGLSGATVQDFVLQQASSTVTTYDLSTLSFDYGGITYNYPVILNTGDCNDYSVITNDVSSLIGMGTQTYHVLLGYFAGVKTSGGEIIRFVYLVPNNIASDQASLELLPNCSPEPVQAWIDSGFTVSSGVYTYNTSSVAAAGATVTSGFTNPPALTRTITGMAGIRFVGTTYSTISNVTSTGNYYGISFSGNSEANMVVDSTVTSSVIYDIFSSSTLDNTLSNVSFLNTSSSISDVGNIYVKFKSRAYVKNLGAAPLGGVLVEYTAYDIRSMSSGLYSAPSVTSDITGYTPYTSALDAYLMTSSSVATTNGGYNPYIVVANATSTYGETHIVDTVLDQQNEEFIITMYTAPTAPTGFATSSVATSSIAFSWTDNSLDEDNFYIRHSIGFFPAYGTSIAADATTGSVTGLTPNTMYEFRLTAQISGSDSTYDSIGSVYTLAQPPGTVTVTANSTQSLTVSWGANSNPDTTEYYVANTTNGGSSTWATSTSRTFTGLSAGTTYNVGVVARNGDSIVTATTTGSGTTQSASGGGGGSTPPVTTDPPLETPPDTTTCNPQTQSCPGTPPTAPSFFFSINGGKKSTKSTTTTLTINNTFPDQIMISTSSVFTGASYQSSVATLPFTLSAGDGLKTIYIKFKKTVDGTAYSFTSSASIMLDTMPPAPPVIGIAKSGIENGKIVGQPQFSGLAEPGTTIRIRYEKRVSGTSGLRNVVHPSAISLLLVGNTVQESSPFEQWFLLAGVVGEYFATADATGYWELSFPLATTPGNYVITVASIDDAGNVSTVTPEVSFSVPDQIVIVGCTNPGATNFNPNATEDNGSCVLTVLGCIDPTAYNFNVLANTDDGSCVPVVLGCRDSTATNYNVQANTSNNSCQYAPQVPDMQEPENNQEVPPVDVTPDVDGGSGTGEDVSTDTGNDVGVGSAGGESTSQSGSTGSSNSSFTSLFTDSSSTLRVALGARFENTQKNIQTFVSSTKATVLQVISVPVEYIVEKIPEPVKKVAKQVQKIADDPQVEEANENIVAPAVVIAGTANVAVGFNLPQLILFLRYLFTQPILLLRRRRQKQWGTIYNVYTKQPIDLATIRVIDAKTGNIVRSQVTDQKGRYFIILPAGYYRVEIQKTGFSQESEMLQKQHSDVVFDRLYQVGSVVYISEKRTELNVNIPLEPLAQNKPTKEIIRVYTKQVAQYIISTIGLYVSILSYLVSPTRFVGMLVLFHAIFLYAFHVLSKRMKRKGAIGVVSDVLNKQKLGRVVVRVFDATYNKLVETIVTDHKGRYGALVGPSIYYVTYDKSGYEKKKSPNLDFSVKHAEHMGGIIARNEVLHPAGQKPLQQGEVQPTQSPPSLKDDPTRTLVKDGDISSDAGDTFRDIAQFGKDTDS